MSVKDKIDDLMKRTSETLEYYNSSVNEKIILTETEMIEKYPYQHTLLNGIFEPEDFGFHDRYLGGNIHKIARVKDTPYFILLDAEFNTLAVHIPVENLDKFTVMELKKLCDKYKKEYSTDTKKDELIAILKNMLKVKV